MGDRESRAGFFDQAVAATALLEVTIDGVTYLAPTSDPGIGRMLYTERRRPEMECLATAVNHLTGLGLNPADTAFLDVGANIGTTVLPAVAIHGFSSAVAIEPEPGNANILRAAVALNNLADRVTVIQAAASHAPGSGVLRRATKSGSHTLVANGNGGRHIQVDVVSLDSLADQGLLPRVGLAWLDVQGSEAAVLEGATTITSDGVPVVLEYSPKTDGGTIWDLAASFYTHALDCRRFRKQGGIVTATADRTMLLQRFGGPENPRSTTDVLLFRA